MFNGLREIQTVRRLFDVVYPVFSEFHPIYPELEDLPRTIEALMEYARLPSNSSNAFDNQGGSAAVLSVLVLNSLLFVFGVALYYVHRTYSKKDKFVEAAAAHYGSGASATFSFFVSSIDKLAAQSGLCVDGHLYLRFQQDLIVLVTTLCVFGLSIVLPVNVHNGTVNQMTGDEERDFTATTVQNIPDESSALWVHTVIAIGVSIAVLVFFIVQHSHLRDALTANVLVQPEARRTLLLDGLTTTADPDSIRQWIASIHICRTNEVGALVLADNRSTVSSRSAWKQAARTWRRRATEAAHITGQGPLDDPETPADAATQEPAAAVEWGASRPQSVRTTARLLALPRTVSWPWQARLCAGGACCPWPKVCCVRWTALLCPGYIFNRCCKVPVTPPGAGGGRAGHGTAAPSPRQARSAGWCSSHSDACRRSILHQQALAWGEVDKARDELQTSYDAAQRLSASERVHNSGGRAIVSFLTEDMAQRFVAQFMHLRTVGAPDLRRALGVKQWVVRPCPSPEDMIWESATVAAGRRRVQQCAVRTGLGLLILLFTSPIAVLNAANAVASQGFKSDVSAAMNALVEYIRGMSPTAADLLLVCLPLLLLMGINALIVLVLTTAAQSQAHISGTALQRALMKASFSWLVLNTLILPALLLSSAYAIVQLLLNDQRFVDILSSIFLSGSGAFFINYLLQRGLLGAVLELWMPGAWLRRWWLQSRAVSAEDRVEAEEQGEFNFAQHQAMQLSVFAMVLVFCTMVPLVLPAGFIYFVIKHCNDRYMLLRKLKAHYCLIPPPQQPWLSDLDRGNIDDGEYGADIQNPIAAPDTRYGHGAGSPEAGKSSSSGPDQPIANKPSTPVTTAERPLGTASHLAPLVSCDVPADPAGVAAMPPTTFANYARFTGGLHVRTRGRIQHSANRLVLVCLVLYQVRVGRCTAQYPAPTTTP